MTATQPTPATSTSGVVDRTVMRLTLAGIAGRRRVWWLLVLPVLLLALAVAVRLFIGTDPDAAVDVLTGFALALLLPLVALIAGTGAIAPEIDDGSIIYLLAKPVPRPRIVRSKLVVAATVIVLTGALSVFAAGLVMVGFDGGISFAFAIGAAIAAVAYAALFLLLGVLSRHAVPIGLAYVLLWEGLVGGYVSGARTLSV
jgi:ABC-2 type transport system permease protein